MKSENIFGIACTAVVIIMVIYYLRRKKKIASLLFGALTGGAALLLINRYGDYLNLDIPLNLFNISGSLVLGIPFVICLVILRIL